METLGGIRVLTLNRPARLNALSTGLLVRLTDEFLDAGSDPDVRVIVVTAVGDRAFCAGMDLKQLHAGDREKGKMRGPMSKRERLAFEVVYETYKPTIAALNGTAVGGGFELALACDIRLACAGAELGLPEAKIGMGAIFASVMLPRRIPTGIALEMLYTGDYLTVEDAARWGLINKVVPRGQARAEALLLAGKIERNAPLSVRRMKEMAIKGLEHSVPTALRLDVGPDPYQSQDRVEGIDAYLAKREPRWQGK